MALLVCLDCTAAYSVDAPRCPQCGSTSYAEEGTEEAEMAKITVHGGPSDAAASPAASDPERDPGTFAVAGGLADDAAEPEEAAESEGLESEEDAAAAYADWSYNDLQGELKNRGLPATGTRAELVERLVDNDQAGEG